MIEVQSGLPSFHVCVDEVDNHRADLVDLQALCNPCVWNTVKRFSWSYIPPVSSCLSIVDLYIRSFLFASFLFRW